MKFPLHIREQASKAEMLCIADADGHIVMTLWYGRSTQGTVTREQAVELANRVLEVVTGLPDALANKQGEPA